MIHQQIDRETSTPSIDLSIKPTHHKVPKSTSIEQYPKGETHANLTDSPFMVANHQSYLDGVIIATELKYPKIMSMSSMRDTPMIGPFMKDMEVIWVDRDDAGSRKNALKGIKRHAKSWKRGERSLAVFPEGTTTSGRTILPFKTGVFSPGKPIRPCVILYTGEADLGQPMMIRSKAGDGHIVLREYPDSEWFDQFLAGMVHSVIVKVAICALLFTAIFDFAGGTIHVG